MNVRKRTPKEDSPRSPAPVIIAVVVIISLLVIVGATINTVVGPVVVGIIFGCALAYGVQQIQFASKLGKHFITILSFVLTVHGIAQSIHTKAADPLIFGALGIAFYGAIAYWLGKGIEVISHPKIPQTHEHPNPNPIRDEINSETEIPDHFYGQAAQEVYEGNVDVDLIAKAFAISGGGEEASKAKYIELRAAQLAKRS